MEQDLERIIASVKTLGKLQQLGPDEDFYEAGFSSINALELLLQLESDHAVSLPDDRFIEARTPRQLLDMIRSQG